MNNFVYHIINIIQRNRWKSLLILIPLYTVLNLGFSWVNNFVLRSPLFLDSIFTAVGAVCLGPLAGTLTAVLTNLGLEVMYGMSGYHWPFMICSISTALILGFMARGGYFSKQIHLTLAILAVTVSNALTGSIMAYLLFSGNSAAGIDVIVSAFTETGMSVLLSAFLARLPANLIDKMIAVYAAYGLKELSQRAYELPE